ncbi:DDB1- and CUL4-associated factor 15 [Latimeria chalumnae]|uniref:DDB1- and CUL4-associated factor 15 n=1 Tax=Latimeria chalumnae TaxID=7897 RepID=UPI0003C1350E|nr:PREDICTED: DDB1- and CUL4-associated factor 15 [Latimeria chalumnae]|eukprot:XP_005994199.1 PREDICTED: DDB1- and CUL4-associated factor 15 [Latimeria chalumnae]
MKMAPSSKAERSNNNSNSGGKKRRGRRENLVRQLDRVKITGRFSHRLFRKLPPRVCVSLKNIVDEEFLEAGHVFLGFTKCGRYVLSYVGDCVDDVFALYVYHLYWWEFNIHNKLKQVREVRLFQDEKIYTELYLTVCEWPSDPTKVIVFGFNICLANRMLMNMMMMSDENHRDIYITAVAMPDFVHCAECKEKALMHPGDSSAQCLQHGFMLHTKYQVVYPFPTFQPAFQLKKDHVVLLNASYSLVACAVSVHRTGEEVSQILYNRTRINRLNRNPRLQEEQPYTATGLESPTETNNPPFSWLSQRALESASPESDDSCGETSTKRLDVSKCSNSLERNLVEPADQLSHVVKAKEFAADIFRRAQVALGSPAANQDGDAHALSAEGRKADAKCVDSRDYISSSLVHTEEERTRQLSFCSGPSCSRSPSHSTDTAADLNSSMTGEHSRMEVGDSALNTKYPGAFSQVCDTSAAEEQPLPPDSDYVNYTTLRYVLEPIDSAEEESEYEDDKISLPFLVTDLKGRNLKPLKESASFQGQYLRVEQLTLDFEYVINEVIRKDAAWAQQFCSFSDYDIVILEVCPQSNQVLINIGLLLLAFPSPSEEGQIRPRTYHTSLKVAWDLGTGVFVTVCVGDLTEVKGQTSGNVWSSYRKNCVDLVMKWLIPERSGQYVNRMTNEALHKGCSLKVLADNERYTWIVL